MRGVLSLSPTATNAVAHSETENIDSGDDIGSVFIMGSFNSLDSIFDVDEDLADTAPVSNDPMYVAVSGGPHSRR